MTEKGKGSVVEHRAPIETTSSRPQSTPAELLPQSAGALHPAFFVARADAPHRRLSGEFATPAEAMRALAWLRHREPAARVVRRQTFYSFIEAAG
jgi:hypothetical protein